MASAYFSSMCFYFFNLFKNILPTHALKNYSIFGIIDTDYKMRVLYEQA